MRDMECKMADGSFVAVSDLPLPLVLEGLAVLPAIFEEDGHGTTIEDARLRLEVELIRRRNGW